MSRLQLLNANANKSLLSGDEAKAVASHLMANVPQASPLTTFRFNVPEAKAPPMMLHLP